MKCVWEHNGNDTLLYCTEYIGAYARGERLEAALSKLKAEIESYCRWAGQCPPASFEVEIVQEKESTLKIADADSDVLFESEKAPLSLQEYEALKALALRSAQDFHALYASVPDKDASCLPPRKTFYGDVPRTAWEMYAHTKNVNTYYFGELNINADNDGTIYECRARGFAALEQTEDFLKNSVLSGSYDELWSLRKLLRRFLWHDRIHAKAMYRMAVKTFGANQVKDPFGFF